MRSDFFQLFDEVSLFLLQLCSTLDLLCLFSLNKAFIERYNIFKLCPAHLLLVSSTAKVVVVNVFLLIIPRNSIVIFWPTDRPLLSLVCCYQLINLFTC